MQAIVKILQAGRSSAGKFRADNKALAATEFAVIVPVMLVMFFGTVELSSAVAVDRKVTLIARTLSDLTSQSSGTMTDANLQNTFTASMSIITPYDNTLVNGTIAQIYIDANSVAKIQWSKSAVIASGATQASLTAPPPTLAANTPRSRR
jgi:Flp pilus assembly protein TadG